MIDSRSLGGFIGEKGALLKHKCISYEWKKPLSRLAKDHVTMLQAGKQLECLINEQVRLQFDLTLLAHIFSAKNKLMYQRSDNFRTNVWSHCFSQNTNKKLPGFLPCVVGAKKLTIFCSYFGRNNHFINSFWN